MYVDPRTGEKLRTGLTNLQSNIHDDIGCMSEHTFAELMSMCSPPFVNMDAYVHIKTRSPGE